MKNSEIMWPLVSTNLVLNCHRCQRTDAQFAADVNDTGGLLRFGIFVRKKRNNAFGIVKMIHEKFE
jgi:hypothetical protein